MMKGPPERELRVDAVVSTRMNFASYQNSVPLLRELVLHNGTGCRFEDLTLEFSTDPAFARARTWSLDSLAPNCSMHLSDLAVELHAGQLLHLDQTLRAEASFVLRRDREEAARHAAPVDLLARNEWGGLDHMPDLLAAFLAPHDPAVGEVLQEASQILRRAKKDPCLDGYGSGGPTRAAQICSAAWYAVGMLHLDELPPPADFALEGQAIRAPSVILESRKATCLDSGLFLAAAFEQAGLNPVLVFTKDQVFTGAWLLEKEFSSPVVEEAGTVRKRCALRELLLFETALLSRQPRVLPKQAIQRAREQITGHREQDFLVALDIRCARRQQIRPLVFAPAPAEEPEQAGDVGRPATVERLQVKRAPAVEEKPRTAETRLERWQRKLADLSLRNPLLNSPPDSKGVVPILCPDPDRLEERLVRGSIRLTALPESVDFGNRPVDPLARGSGEDPVGEYVAQQALERGEAVVPLEAQELEQRLVKLYRAARSDLQEGGADTLFLALGFLVWRRAGQVRNSYRAPLILLPVELTRRNVRSGIRMKRYQDEAKFNSTLLQLLRQDFGLDIPGLDGPLPEHEHGTDVAGTWQRIRQYTKDMSGFEVVTEVVLGRFSFAKHLVWKDLVDLTDRLREHRVVGRLLKIPGASHPPGPEAPFPEPETPDRSRPPEELFTPMPADSTQLSAVIACDQGRDFVLIGPPGTGKSQTITNMIAHSLAKGQSVLFVSEKIAALEVVYRRLKAIGLDRHCLELHSDKTRRSKVLKQFREAWHAAAPESVEDRQRESARLQELRDELNLLGGKLMERHPNRLSVYRAIGDVTRRSDMPRISFPWVDVEAQDGESLEKSEEIAHRLDLYAEQADPESRHRFASIRRGDWSSKWEQELVEAAALLETAAADYDRILDRLIEALRFDLKPVSEATTRALVQLAQALPDACRKDLSFALHSAATRVIASVREGLGLLEQYQASFTGLSVPYREHAWKNLDVEQLAEQWRTATGSWWLKSLLGKRRVRNILITRGAAGGRPDCEADLSALLRQKEIAEQLRKLEYADQAACWQGLYTDLPAAQEQLQAADAIAVAARELSGTCPETLTSLREALRRIVVEASDLLDPEAAIGRICIAAARAGAELDRCLQSYAEAAGGRAEEQVPPDREHSWPARLATAMRQVVRHRDGLRNWCAWCQVRAEADAAGLGDLAQVVEQGRIPVGQAQEAFRVNYRRWWLGKIFDDDEVLHGFRREKYEDLVRRFQEQDQRYAQLTCRQIQARLHAALPEPEELPGNSGLALLKQELEKKQCHRPVRRLLQELGDDLTRLTPCLLMSPLSIAQYLPADRPPFDLVLFDEASQITVWDAVGAIARGRQTVVVGDPKQLPPTGFFRKADAEADEDADLEGDLDSILEECLGAGLPKLDLGRHYRSRRESLITFSNHRYYDNRLITFPSPAARDHAVRFNYVENGVYDRGKSRTNKAEAERVVRHVVEHLKGGNGACPPPSIGIVTANGTQQALVENLLDGKLREHPELEPYFRESEDCPEPVFVKNLENVQGDERDVILFSVTYGPDRHGRVSMNFGIFNRQGGERHLNVAITRAREKLCVYSTLHPRNIDLHRTRTPGLRDLKHFMEFAERGTGALAEAVQPPPGEAESPFEEAVAEQLHAKGWEIHKQVGVSRFRIDLGVVHPARKDSYLAGIECDGAGYRRSATARDRDIMRAGILTTLGWTILRAWSADWWRNPEQSAETLHLTLQKLARQQ